MKPAEITAALSGTQFLLAMVETRRAARNGDSKPDLASPQGTRKNRAAGRPPRGFGGTGRRTQRQIEDLRQTDRGAAKGNLAAPRQPGIKTELARHPQRPYSLDYIEKIFTDWSEIHGDRHFADDPAMVCGIARFHGEEVLVLGTKRAAT